MVVLCVDSLRERGWKYAVRAATEIRKARPHEGWESSKKNASHRREIGNEETCSVTHVRFLDGG